MNTTVDIILATYNGSEYLVEQLESIARQSYTNWHMYVGDDGSTDSTSRILLSFYDLYPGKMTLLPSCQRLGVTANFSKILGYSRSNYILLADQDDIWIDQKIERMLAAMQTAEQIYGQNTPLLVHSDLILIDAAGTQTSPSFWRHQHISPLYGQSLKNCMVQNTVTGCACIVNRALLDKALPIPQEAIMHDWWLAMTAAALGKIIAISDRTVLYRQHDKNHTGAKSWSLSHMMKQLKTGKPALRKRIRRTQVQANAFLLRFSNQLEQEDVTILTGYSSLQNMNPLQCRKFAWKHHLKKDGMIRSVGFYWAL